MTMIDDFHRLYYDAGHASEGTWKQTYWLGVPVQKCPFDLWVYQEILFELRPDLLIECGTYRGGSALFLASVFDLIDHGRVLTIDIQEQDGRPEHPRIEYLSGSSADPDVICRVEDTAAGTVMVLLDSDHTQDHVAKELEAYAPFVSKGSYLIVEDTNINGHPVYPDFGPGPMEAVKEFLPRHPEFVADLSREKLLFTFNPDGYLRRIADAGSAT